MPTSRFTFRREAPVYMPTGRRPVSFWARSARVHAHRPQAGLLSGAKRPCTCPPAGGRFPFGREAPVYLPTGRRPVSFGREAPVCLPTGRWPVSFRARSARVPAHRSQAGFLSGAKRPFTCPPAAGRFHFGREAPVYLPTGRFPFGRKAPVYLPTGRRPLSFRARSARVPAHRPQAGFLL